MVAPVTWRDELAGAEWVHPAVVPQMDDVWARARTVTSDPLEYVGAGASSVVLRDGDRALKFGRWRAPTIYSMLETEGEFLADGHALDPEHVVRPRLFLADPLVLVKDYVPGRSFSWLPQTAQDWFVDFTMKLQAINWGPPEYKEDSFVRTDTGFVLVDGGHASRLCSRLVRWVEDWLDGARHPWSVGALDESFLAFLVRREVQEGCVTDESARRVLGRLGHSLVENARSYVSWIVYMADEKGKHLRDWEPATAQAATQMMENLRWQARSQTGVRFGVMRSRKKPLLEVRDGIVQPIRSRR